MARRKRGFRSLGYASYQDYLRSEHWQEMRRQFFASRKKWQRCCYVCGAADKPLDVHHKTYLRIGRERPTDLIALCRECHQEVHKRSRSHWAMWNTHKKLRAKRRKKASG